MAIERRHFLRAVGGYAGLAVGGFTGLATPAGAGRATTLAESSAQRALFFAARKNGAAYEAVVLDAQGRLQRAVALPERGHSFALDPAGHRAVVFGRQPGFFALSFDLHGQQAAQPLPLPLPLPEGRHFFGHGVFVREGALLLATENDYAAGRGVIGVYAARRQGGYQRVGEFASGGIGPHELVAVPGTSLIVVANGGILTHPDYGKMALNLASMRPSLTYLDVDSGEIVEQLTLPDELHQLSIRHLAVDARNRVWFGCQYSGPAADRPPLVGSHALGEALRLHPGDPEVLRAMRNYVGSLAVDASGTVVAASSPVGGLVTYWDTENGRLLGTTPLADGCGVAPADTGQFLLSSGRGVLALAGPQTLPARVVEQQEVAWDNHLRRMLMPV